MSATTSNNKKAFEELIGQNHREYDLFFNDYYHNHSVHLLGSLYDLGATGERMREQLQKGATQHLRKLGESKYQINESNYRQYTGKNDAYRDLTDFFDGEVAKLGFDTAFQKYAPSLIPGLAAQVIHPLIHLGYATEFRNDLILGEALAFATLAYDAAGELVDKVHPGHTSKDIISILDEMRVDPRFNDLEGLDIDGVFERSMDAEHVRYIQEYFTAWDPQENLEHKIHELARAITLLFLGHPVEQPPNFYICHLMTGLHGTRVILPYLSKNDQVRALRLMWLTTLRIFIFARKLKPKWEYVTEYPINNLSSDKAKAWEKISQAAIDDEDIHGHAIKSVRAMKKLAEAYPEDEEMWRRGSWKVTDLIHVHEDWGFELEPTR
ncbi:hypothetical protein K493DRAFT_352803 [Basidiobolus meristosporus CBS 931.73]|uniref:DUF4243 domain-containing protein n=1 Tax=Basidiobolus meristosporus CBS 931.73 TaxID=1314790 RepID=A0A1Y1Y7V8_9FUNG|nr:hypothetical protein K493DRAFT_352803 [Basidiobolus meristosporus CBS 931.73]|eukprot:ORX94097.1 hypothetical protein K493DRAFT_352803 [Basidiobolus meristosporus CBS 931.73]